MIKTHMPTKLLPTAPDARYVYVTRHPVACFASCVDFIGMLTGPAAPSLPALLDWFCSEGMWWGPWRFLASGRADRHADVGPGERERILAFCRERLRGAAYPAARFYPELA